MSYISNFYDPFAYGGMYKKSFPYGSFYAGATGSHTQTR